MVNIKTLLTNILNMLTLKSGFSMTGELKNSDGAVAIGSGQASSNTIANLLNEVRYSSGCMGSAEITSTYTANNVTIATGWYNYCWIPHRSGGQNGISMTGNDNANYGNLFLFGMTVDSAQYIIKVQNVSSITVCKLDTAEPSSIGTFTAATTTNYSIETSATRSNWRKLGQLVVITLGVTAKSPANWASAAIATGAPATYDSKEVYGALCCDDDHSTVAIAIQGNGSIKAGGGVANKLYYGTIYYIAAS